MASTRFPVGSESKATTRTSSFTAAAAATSRARRLPRRCAPTSRSSIASRWPICPSAPAARLSLRRARRAATRTELPETRGEENTFDKPECPRRHHGKRSREREALAGYFAPPAQRRQRGRDGDDDDQL